MPETPSLSKLPKNFKSSLNFVPIYYNLLKSLLKRVTFLFGIVPKSNRDIASVNLDPLIDTITVSQLFSQRDAGIFPIIV